MHMEDFEQNEATVDAIHEGMPRGRAWGKVIHEVLEQTGGQPFLTIYLCDRAVQTGSTTPAKVSQMIDEYVDQMRGKPEDLVRTIERYLLEQETELYRALSIYLGIFPMVRHYAETKRVSLN